ncbi:unnamed protein product [Rhizophagus irregularis]|uniref:Uncharacterized protein n=1 Tax=Rhizophagus irregularis TaxID=588596 RepID=A0A2I1EJM5_9GLOM|nr:hypothetical protein RhiirB3_525694 [Rhizophagus irregularis]CAB5378728.1 unnamed protein product [Rhizophagus irregularis]
MSPITLTCLVQCENPNPKNIFKVKIEKNKSIKELKKEIKKKKHNNFVNLSANEIQLWKVNIPFEKPNDKSNILNAQLYASIKEELEGEELDGEKNISEYFPYELGNEHINIIVQRERINVAFFGLTGHGKSSIANMLIQGDIHQNNAFKVNNGAKGETINIHSGVNEIFQVFDTIGLGESSSGSVPHKEAIKRIRDYFSRCQVPLNYICYVKKQDRFTEEDAKMFKIFKKIFKGGEVNFNIIITHSKPEWVEENYETIKENFGNHPIIPVDFPWNNNGDFTQTEKRQRDQSLERLLDTLLRPGNNGIKLEVLSSSQAFETNVSEIVSLVPIVGSAYQLISSGVYYTLGKPTVAKERFREGVVGGYADGMSFISSGLGSSVMKVLAKNVGKRIALKIVNQVKEKIEKSEEKLYTTLPHFGK